MTPDHRSPTRPTTALLTVAAWCLATLGPATTTARAQDAGSTFGHARARELAAMTGSVDHEVVNQRASHQARVLAAMDDAFAHEVHE